MNKKQTAQDIVQADLNSIYIGNLNTVDDDLKLPENGKYGSRFVWSTGESRFIDENGKVNRPLYGMGNRKVILRVTAVYEENTDEREFAATVLQREKEMVIVKIHQVELFVKPGNEITLPSVVVVDCEDGRRMTARVKWEEHDLKDIQENIVVKGVIAGSDKTAEAVIRCWKQEEEVPMEKIKFFPIHSVRLQKGTLYYEHQQLMLEYLLHCNDDQMLYNFRKACGLDTLDAPPMTGWDEEACKLKGHTTGHYLSGLALAWGATCDERFLKKIHYMVNELKKCQEEFAKSGKYHRGFLSAYSEEQFDLLEQFVKYPEIWAPYYTLDKIMSGLYDCYEIAGEEKAREVLELMGDWVYDRLSRLSKETLDKMWSMYIAGEYGGMLGIMVKIHRMTGREKYLLSARLFDNEKLFYPMEQKLDTLEDIHANQHIPQIIGAMEMFRTTGELKYWKIGKHFWEIVTSGHVYCMGGVGETEMFHRAESVCEYLSEKTAESCASYNMLRLTGQIFAYTADGAMMDYYDNVLRNHILASSSHKPDGGTTYFMPLGPGESKEYSTVENTCCHGTGMESRFRYMENIYSYNEKNVYVNLLIASELLGDINIRIQNLSEDTVRIFCEGDMNKALQIHIPNWVQEEFAVSVNGKTVEAKLEKGYFKVPNICRAGDEIIIKMPMRLRILGSNSQDSFVNIAYGPYILAARSKEKEYLKAPALNDIHKKEEILHFEANGVEMVPLAIVDEEPYHVYFRK